MTREPGGRARMIRWAAILSMLLCAWIAGAQAQPLLQFSLNVSYVPGPDDTPVHAELIRVKPTFDPELPATKQDTPPGIVAYNLDIYGVLHGKERVSIGSPKCRPTVVVLFTHRSAVDGHEPRIYYWVPPTAGSAKGTWVTHEQVVATGKRGLGGMEVSPLEATGKPGEYRFEIRQWPLDDRMMCHGN